MKNRIKAAAHGGTIPELAVVMTVIGALAAFAVPRFMASQERSKACEAFSYLSAVRSAQERHRARSGAYAGRLIDLDVAAPPPRYFSTGRVAPGPSGGLRDSWRVTLTRSSGAGGYGRYTVTFTEHGFEADMRRSTIVSRPAINPMAK